MATVKVTVEFEKPLYDAVCDYVRKYRYYEGLGGFIVEAVRRHMENLYVLVKAKH